MDRKGMKFRRINRASSTVFRLREVLLSEMVQRLVPTPALTEEFMGIP